MSGAFFISSIYFLFQVTYDPGKRPRSHTLHIWRAHQNTLTLKSDPSMRGDECPLTLNRGRPFIKTHLRKPLNDRDFFFPSRDSLPEHAQPGEGMLRKRGNKQNYHRT
ncbi:hypothetical protein TNIN_182551 [Trichonephila inaurata madagascariensis]|uniref:Uncharacterized protein n=1 Tax=Trichonephila inaurata madagascariensis TaxID=2747483 RepID=A0A8X6JV60_9ARAC|nr:hypothetical protein TNIN_182551 [Trichonephila inaurata madagascariensis]